MQGAGDTSVHRSVGGQVTTVFWGFDCPPKCPDALPSRQPGERRRAMMGLVVIMHTLQAALSLRLSVHNMGLGLRDPASCSKLAFGSGTPGTYLPILNLSALVPAP